MRLTCPIGQGPLKSKEPGVIAVAVAAELLGLRESRADAGVGSTRPQSVTRRV
jgi:xanthine/CO dehydrogenase XdhC/CoxF family maturation factor